MTDESTVQAMVPSNPFRKGLTLVEMIRNFPDERVAEAWLAEVRWLSGHGHPHRECGNVQPPMTRETSRYRCCSKGCRELSSVRRSHGTVHHVSLEHLSRAVANLAGQHDPRPLGSGDLLAESVREMSSKHLRYAELAAS